MLAFADLQTAENIERRIYSTDSSQFRSQENFGSEKCASDLGDSDCSQGLDPNSSRYKSRVQKFLSGLEAGVRGDPGDLVLHLVPDITQMRETIPLVQWCVTAAVCYG